MTFTIPQSAQHSQELYQLIGFLRAKNVRKYIEIGVRHGGTFYRIASCLPKGALVVAVDWPMKAWGANSEQNLRGVIAELNSQGYNAHMILGDSAAPDTIQQVLALSARYDAAFIDGDHLYPAVLRDYTAYAPFCDILAFHDIIGTGKVQVARLWGELKHTRNGYCEILGENSKMGIGILYQQEQPCV